MFLRLMLIISFVFSFGFSVELTKYYRMQKDLSYPDGNVDIRIDYKKFEELNPKDWIGIYKKGDSVEWKNVKAWSWVKDLYGFAPLDIYGHIFSRKNLPPATYEARFFKNNSYKIEKSVEFTIKKSDSFLEKLSVFFDDAKKSLRVVPSGINENFKPNPKDWMAIYKVGSPSTWSNVIRWIWVRDLAAEHKGYIWNVKNLDLPQGKYEVRYFLNNSYDIYKKSDYFSIVKDNSMVRLDDLTLEYKYNQTFKIKFYDTTANKQDWVAIFKKGAKRIRENILSWNYNRSGRKSGEIYINTGWVGEDGVFYTDLKPGEYDIVFFSNNTYKVLATSKLIVTNDKQPSIRVTKAFLENSKISIYIEHHPYAKRRDWVAVFKAGKVHKRENILAWSYTYAKTFVRMDGFVDGGKYIAVLFSDNSYNEISSFDFSLD